MKYFDPKNVLSPKDYIENVEVIHDDGENGFSLAKVIWEGNECIAIRWNVARREREDNDKIHETKTCVGMPSSHGYPVWFILPDELLNKESEVFIKLEKYLNLVK